MLRQGLQSSCVIGPDATKWYNGLFFEKQLNVYQLLDPSIHQAANCSWPPSSWRAIIKNPGGFTQWVHPDSVLGDVVWEPPRIWNVDELYFPAFFRKLFALGGVSCLQPIFLRLRPFCGKFAAFSDHFIQVRESIDRRFYDGFTAFSSKKHS